MFMSQSRRPSVQKAPDVRPALAGLKRSFGTAYLPTVPAELVDTPVAPRSAVAAMKEPLAGLQVSEVKDLELIKLYFDDAPAR